jgi:hypothetical protein
MQQARMEYFYFYQILTAFNKLKIMSDVALLQIVGLSLDLVKPKTIKFVFAASPIHTQYSRIRAKTFWRESV